MKNSTRHDLRPTAGRLARGLVAAAFLASLAAPAAAVPQTTSWGCPAGFEPTIISFAFESANPNSTALPQGTEIGFDDDDDNTSAPLDWTCPSSGQCIFQPATQTFSKGCNLNRPNGGAEADCSQPWSDVGVYLHFDLIEADRGALDDNTAADDSRGPLMTFDTGSTANGDTDLRSPHGGNGTSSGCPAGSPGVGDAQAGPGRFYANCPTDVPDDPVGDPSGDLDDPDDGLNNPLQNVMILSTNGNTASPNDDSDGGTMIILFPDFATTILRVATLDVDGEETRPQMRLFSDLYGGNILAPTDGCDPDDNDSNAGTLYNNANSELELGDVDCGTNINEITNTQHVDADDDSPGGNVTTSTDDDTETTGDNTRVIQTNINTLYAQVDPDITADGGQLVRRMEYELLGSGSLDEIVYCRRTTFTPVTVAEFAARPNGSGVSLEWSTTTETRNAGFHLYVETPGGWKRINTALVPSQAVDSTTPLHYRFDAPGVRGDRFRIEDVSVRGVRTVRGETERGQALGERPGSDPIPWSEIHAERSLHAEQGGDGLWSRGAEARGSNARPVAELRLDQVGLYRVTYEQLMAAGLDFREAQPSHLALTRHAGVGSPPQARVAVPRRVVTAVGRRFGPGSYVEFLGEPEESLYTSTAVYRLEVDPTAVRRVGNRRVPGVVTTPTAAYQETRIVDENNAYGAGSATGDPWYNLRLISVGSPANASVTFEVDHLEPGPARLTMRLYGVTNFPHQDPDHHLRVGLNGVELADVTFDGPDALDLDLPLPDGLLLEGTNRIDLSLPSDLGLVADIVDLDSYAVTYSRAFVARSGELSFDSPGRQFEVGGFAGASAVSVYVRKGSAVTRLANVGLAGDLASFRGLAEGGLEYWVVAEESVRTPQIALAPPPAEELLKGRTDLLIVSHRDFLGPAPAGMVGLDDLAAARRSGPQPLRVKTVAVDELYDRYTGGVVDPEALRAYLRDVVPALGVGYVLLVGGDTYDYHDYLGLGSISFVPTAYVETGDEFPVRFTPADAWFVDLDEDRVPDLPIGRLPVRTRAELDALVEKILLYPSAPHGQKALLVADERDGSLSFSSLSESLRDQLPGPWAVTTAYADQLGVAAARDKILDTLNQGVAVTSYFGHSGPTFWGRGLLTAAQLEVGLTNVGLPTVATQWGCWNTYFVEPRLNTMAHKLLLGATPERGAAAVLGSATLTEVLSEVAFGPELLGRMVQPGQRLGDAIQEAKEAVVTDGGGPEDVVLGWTLLGDPTLVISP